MAQLVAYITTAALWIALAIVVCWLFSLERRSHRRHKAQVDVMRRTSNRRLP